MPELNTELKPVHITARAAAGVSFTRGLRGAMGADTFYTLAGINEIGTVVCCTPTEVAAGYFLATRLNGSAAVPAVASEAVAPGDIAYSAANGKTSKTATSATRVGVWRTTTAQDTLGEIMPD